MELQNCCLALVLAPRRSISSYSLSSRPAPFYSQWSLYSSWRVRIWWSSGSTARSACSVSSTTCAPPAPSRPSSISSLDTGTPSERRWTYCSKSHPNSIHRWDAAFLLFPAIIYYYCYSHYIAVLLILLLIIIIIIPYENLWHLEPIQTALSPPSHSKWHIA